MTTSQPRLLSERAELVRWAIALALFLLVLARHLDAFILEQWFPGWMYPEGWHMKTTNVG